MYRSNLLPKLYLSQSDTKLNNTNYSCPQLYPATPITNRSVRLPSISSHSSGINEKEKPMEIMPQYRRMQILEEKIRLLENRNISNNEQLKTMIENDYLAGRRYPKYTIIQNTPLTTREEIINEILKQKIGPDAVYSSQFPKIIFRDQEEINKIVTNTIMAQKKENITKDLQKTENQLDVINEEKDDNKKNLEITNDLLYDLQRENFDLRNKLKETETKMKNIQVDVDLKIQEMVSKQMFTIESLKRIINKGGSKKLKASMQSILENKAVNIDEVENDDEQFAKKVPDLIQQKIEEAQQKIKAEQEEKIRLLEEKLKQEEQKRLELEEKMKKKNKKKKDEEEEEEKKETVFQFSPISENKLKLAIPSGSLPSPRPKDKLEINSKDEEESLQSRHSKNKNKVSNTSPQMDYQFSKAEVDERQTESDQVHNKKRKKKRRLQKKKVIKEENEENDD